ncbi:hypothetical protein KOW79_002087 [Hemibagrus wyckioides]|uniref:Uncharacterized protein n=1 Tax=Hemibagrus wyckioides TaxID=337641 RepID=A0A9D3SSN7_9TELE|nr:hypothetical protein KOW79_002087 [Hemibagrus wyckioides]
MADSNAAPSFFLSSFSHEFESRFRAKDRGCSIYVFRPHCARFRRDAVVPKRQVQSACRARRVSRDSGCCEGATVNKGSASGAADAAEGKATASRGCAVEKTPRCVLAVTWPDSTGNEGEQSRKSRRSLGSMAGTACSLAERVAARRGTEQKGRLTVVSEDLNVALLSRLAALSVRPASDQHDDDTPYSECNYFNMRKK